MRQRFSERAFDTRYKASAARVDDADRLNLVARRNAATTQYALIVVAHEILGGVVHVVRVHSALVLGRIAAVFGGKRLQLALAAPDAAETFLVVIAEHKLQSDFARRAHLGRVSEHLHALGNNRRARGHELTVVFKLYHAHAAAALVAQILHIAQCGNFKARFDSRVEHARALGYGYGNSVYCQIYVFHFFS